MKRLYLHLAVASLLTLSSPGYGADFIYTVSGGWQYVRFFNGIQWVGYEYELPYSGSEWGAASYLRLGDFNGDGLLEVASLNGSMIRIKLPGIYCPEWDPHESCLKSLPPFFVESSWGVSGYTRVGDFNGDGRDDIASPSAGSVYMKLATGVGSLPSLDAFTSQTWGVTNVWGQSGYTWVLDFNGDGRDDIASGDGSSLHMKTSTGSAFLSQTYGVSAQWGGADYTRVGDFDGNGLPDIASPNAGQVHLKLSTGIGFSSVTWPVSNAWGGAGHTWAADFNNDGRTDIASAAGGVVYMKLSQGNSFSSQGWGVNNQWGGAGHTWVMDYNGDGWKDIVSATPGWLYIKRNSNGTSFVSEAWPIAGWWGAAEFTWGSDRF